MPKPITAKIRGLGRVNYLLCPLVGGFLGLLAAGCQSSSFAKAQWNSRLERMKYPVERFVAEERRRPAKLEQAGDWIEQTIAHDAAKTRRNVDAVGDWYERDVIRFRTRMRGPYQRGLKQFFGGKPENIEPNAIQMFF